MIVLRASLHLSIHLPCEQLGLASYELSDTNQIGLASFSGPHYLSAEGFGVFRRFHDLTRTGADFAFLCEQRESNPQSSEYKSDVLPLDHVATYHHVLLQLRHTLLDTAYNTRYAFHLPATRPIAHDNGPKDPSPQNN